MNSRVLPILVILAILAAGGVLTKSLSRPAEPQATPVQGGLHQTPRDIAPPGGAGPGAFSGKRPVSGGPSNAEQRGVGDTQAQAPPGDRPDSTPKPLTGTPRGPSNEKSGPAPTQPSLRSDADLAGHRRMMSPAHAPSLPVGPASASQSRAEVTLARPPAPLAPPVETPALTEEERRTMWINLEKALDALVDTR